MAILRAPKPPIGDKACVPPRTRCNEHVNFIDLIGIKKGPEHRRATFHQNVGHPSGTKFLQQFVDSIVPIVDFVDHTSQPCCLNCSTFSLLAEGPQTTIVGCSLAVDTRRLLSGSRALESRTMRHAFLGPAGRAFSMGSSCSAVRFQQHSVDSTSYLMDQSAASRIRDPLTIA